MRRFNFLKIILSFVVLAALALLGLSQANAIEDWFKLRNYQAPAGISALAQQDTMTPKAIHLFYVNHPALIASVPTFRQDCPESEQTIVLGCYHSGENGIFVYQVSDSRLNGVQQVTAAHEMLHGAYERLSPQDRNYVNNLLQSYYNTGLHDQRIIDTINAYKKTEPNDVVNEMHSVFGTEVLNLPAPLESYYKQYFTNRAVVAAYAQDYQDEFSNLLSQATADEAQLSSLKAQIDTEETSLDSQLVQINSDRARLDSQKNNGQIDQYNAGVASFNAEIDAYNNALDKLHADIDRYNTLIAAHNDIVAQLRSLNQALDTRLSPQTAR